MPERGESRIEGVLPLEASIERSPQGWSIRLPVRAEQVEIEKRVVVVEEVVVGRQRVEDVVRIEATTQREYLDVEAEGGLDIQRDVRRGPQSRTPYTERRR